MPRLARLDAPGALHHVMGPDESGFSLCSNSSIDRIKIFINKKDREYFFERLADLCKAAWCGFCALSWHKHLCC